METVFQIGGIIAGLATGVTMMTAITMPIRAFATRGLARRCALIAVAGGWTILASMMLIAPTALVPYGTLALVVLVICQLCAVGGWIGSIVVLKRPVHPLDVVTGVGALMLSGILSLVP